jgi:hypothetical protein
MESEVIHGVEVCAAVSTGVIQGERDFFIAKFWLSRQARAGASVHVPPDLKPGGVKSTRFTVR